MIETERWRVEYFPPGQPGYDWHLKNHLSLLKDGHEGMPAVLNKPQEPDYLGGVLDGFYLLQSSGDWSIGAMSKMYKLCGCFDEKSFFEIMLNLRNELEGERERLRAKNG